MATTMAEEALIARAKEEREKIFQRYEKGREDGAVIDSWEDPTNEVYHLTDRYGFIHDYRLPQKHDQHEIKASQIEKQRSKKWVKMIALEREKKQKIMTHPKLHKRVYKGIPDSLRGGIWSKLLNLESIMPNKKDTYERMLKLARVWSPEARQIDSDVNRQFREHIDFRERYSLKQKSLFNVLVAYSMYNSEVGYCQGMSGLAGVLLMYMNEEEAFWALNVLLTDKKYAMHGLFIEGFPKLTRFLAHHDKIIGKFIPKLKKHFEQYNLDSILYSLKWFFVVFIERIPFSLCLRVWDVYLLDGEKVVTGMAYTILRLHKSKILKLKDMDLIVQYIQTKLHKDFGYDDDFVMKTLEQCMDDLRKENMELPPPAGENEIPKKKFGVFEEPTMEAKIGHRKQEFTDTEKKVTSDVKLKRELTEQENANSSQDAATGGGSTNQLNAVHVPESEDGGSLLGSSRKSLAETSVTSTADLSGLSGGQSQRSQQAFDFFYEDHKPIESADEGEGESSPGLRKLSTVSSKKGKPLKGAASAIGSMSVVERSPSAQLMTPRAISPHDVVRIYVPPAPPEELRQASTTVARTASTSTMNRTSMSSERDLTIANGMRQTMSGGSSNQLRQTADVEEDDDDSKTRRNSEIDINYQTYSSGRFDVASETYGTTSSVQNYGLNGRSTSSSRRGSMSRKSPAPMLESEFIIECSHLKNRKYTPDHHTSHNSLVLNVGNANGGSRNSSTSNIHRMTSFEELAKAKYFGGSNSSLLKNANEDYIIRQMVRAKMTNRITKSDIYETIDSSESGSNDRYGLYSSMQSQQMSRGHKSDYNIQYKNLSSRAVPRGDSGNGYSEYNSIEYRTFKTPRNSGGSGNESSPFDYDLLPDNRVENNALKNYNRFFNNEDDDEDKLLGKSSDESSTSPPPRQPPHQKQTQNGNTPSGETIPLLSSPMAASSGSRTVYSSHQQPPSSMIPVSSSGGSHSGTRKYSTESFRLELSSPVISGSRHNSSASAKQVLSPTSLSRIPVIKSPPSSLQGSFRNQQPHSSRIPTSSQYQPASAVRHYYGDLKSPSPGPSSLVSQASGSTYDYGTSRSRIGSSSSAHQIQSDSNKIRIQINPSQSYSSG